jgi:excisionase family DNA binding protein
MTRVQFAQRVDISVRKLNRLMRDGKVPHIRSGRWARFTERHVQEFLASLEVKPQAQKVQIVK